jgi:hypothetical protein
MDLDKLPDNEIKPLNEEIVSTSRKRKYGLLIAGLMLMNIILFILLSNEEGNISHKLFVGLKTLAAGSIVAGFGLGLITSLIPNKNAPYSEKYFRASLLNILVIQIILIPVQIFFGMYE